ncbi:MAG: prepilin-type N-terminal cleavage/methylation domain-containing protein [Verrucomicrobiaceae bacterium]|nr:prepilin-type N-terminal cleavage/methylation domain-containing protein [Verrucomicrobiaceae bacterium]
MTKTQQRHRNMMQPAFTLMEILTVIAIIAVLASLTFGGMSYYDQKMKFSRTEVLIASIERALEDYKSDNGSYPSGNIGDCYFKPRVEGQATQCQRVRALSYR